MINTSYIFETLINNLEKSKVDLLSLKVGQIIKGSVVQLFDGNQALVSIKGTTVLAKIEVPLTKGQQSIFLVTSADDEIKLKLLKEGGSANNQPNSTAITKEVLKYLDLKNSTTNKQIVEGFIKENLPLDKMVVKTISSLLDEGYEFKNLLSASKVLNDKKLPITDTNLRVVSQFFNEEGLANKLIKLNDSISKYPNINKLPDDVAKLLARTEEQIGRLLSEYRVTTTVSPTVNQTTNLTVNQTANQTVKFLGNSTVDPNVDPKIVNNTNPNVNYVEKLTININSANSTNVASLGNVTNAYLIESKNILHKLTSFMEEMQLKPFENIQTENVSLKENLEQLYKNKELLPKEIVSNLERTVQHLAGQQLINQPDTSPFSQLIFQFPSMAPFSDKPVYMKFQAKKQEGSRSIDPKDVSLAFLFQLKNIGDLVIKVKINDNQMFIQFMNNNPTTKEILKQLEPPFVQFLQEQGYKTSGFTFLPLVETKQDNFTETTTSYKGVDIRL